MTEGPRFWIRMVAWAAASGAVLAVVLVAAALYSTSTTRTVRVLNDHPTELRLSGCVDDADDVLPQHTTEVSAPIGSSVGCDVYSFGKYLGCLTLRGSRHPSDKPALISASLDPHLGRAACEKIG